MMAAVRNSLAPLFEPRSVAIYGASSDPRKIGGRPLDFLKRSGFAGALYPINPKTAQIQGLPAFASLAAAPGPVDLAVIAVPAPAVVAAVEDCTRHGVRGAVILSSGFAEAGGEGVQWQQRLAEIARESGMRIVGPNCLGIINAGVGLLATFSPTAADSGLTRGGVSVVSQSGAFGGYCLGLLRQRGIGLNLWITTGNQSDVDFADCVEHFVDDPATRVIVGYLEGATDGHRLIATLERAQRCGKPVVVMKVGSSEAGAAAAASHTASLAGADAVYEGVFRQYGVYRARTIDELFDVAYACSTARSRPAGDRLGLVTISGGVGVLMADAAAPLGLDVAPMPDDAQRELKALLPFAGTRNPVDTTAHILNDMSLFQKNLELVLERGNYDQLIVFLSTVGLVPGISLELIAQLRHVLARFPDRLVTISTLSDPSVRKLYEAEGMMVFDDPARAVRVAAALRHFARVATRAGSGAPAPELPHGALPVPSTAVNEVAAKALLASAGIPVVRELVAATADAAAGSADEIGYPVVLKIASADIAHKSEIGGVIVGLRDEAQVRAAFGTLMQRAEHHAPRARLDGVVVARMAGQGVETILGVVRDPVFGPVVMFGLGGVFVEAFKDVAFRVAPFGVDEARAMINEVKGRILLTGLRGQPPSDENALADAIAALSVYAAHHEADIESIDINPFVVLAQGQGGLALDALIVPRAKD